mgnify:CR=1 FL=1
MLRFGAPTSFHLQKGQFVLRVHKKDAQGRAAPQPLTVSVEDLAGSLESLVCSNAHSSQKSSRAFFDERLIGNPLPLTPPCITLYFTSPKRNTPWAPHPIRSASTMT